MSIAFVSAATATNNPTSTAVSVAQPAGVTAGMLLLFIIWNDNNAAGAAAPTYVAASFTNFINRDLGPGSGDAYITVGWRVATGSEPANYTATLPANGGGWSAAVLAYSGVDTTSPIDASTTNQGAQTATPATCTESLTTLTANTMLVAAHGPAPLGGFTSTPSWTMAGFTSRVQISTTDWTGLFVAEAAQAAAGASGTKTASMTFTAAAAAAQVWGTMFSLKQASTSELTLPAHQMAGGMRELTGGMT